MEEETILHYFDKQGIEYINDITTEELVEMFIKQNASLDYNFEGQNIWINLTEKELSDIFWFKQTENPFKTNCYSTEQLLRYIVTNLIAKEKGNYQYFYTNGYTTSPMLVFNPLRLKVNVEKICTQDNKKSDYYNYYIITLFY